MAKYNAHACAVGLHLSTHLHWRTLFWTAVPPFHLGDISRLEHSFLRSSSRAYQPMPVYDCFLPFHPHVQSD